MKVTEQLQKDHYDKLAFAYEAHYDDYWSQAYRRLFVYSRLFLDSDLRGKAVLEAMCGSGQATSFLISHGATVTALDISDKLIKSLRLKHPGVKAVCAPILDSGLPSDHFDAVVVIGGLHHLHPHVSEAVTEIHRILKKNGLFYFFEPHQSSWFNWLRSRWYGFDPTMFESNEAAIDTRSLASHFRGRFRPEWEHYAGSIAYLFVYNSLVWRIPLFLKKFYSAPLFVLEWLFNLFVGEKMGMYVLGRWRKIS